ncbi:hypothetical protein D1157_04705 [Anaerotruncus sp. X29]|nr:hypothetical protein [Anaerotruncus sp. X29]
MYAFVRVQSVRNQGTQLLIKHTKQQVISIPKGLPSVKNRRQALFFFPACCNRMETAGANAEEGLSCVLVRIPKPMGLLTGICLLFGNRIVFK